MALACEAAPRCSAHEEVRGDEVVQVRALAHRAWNIEVAEVGQHHDVAMVANRSHRAELHVHEAPVDAGVQGEEVVVIRPWAEAVRRTLYSEVDRRPEKEGHCSNAGREVLVDYPVGDPNRQRGREGAE